MDGETVASSITLKWIQSCGCLVTNCDRDFVIEKLSVFEI